MNVPKMRVYLIRDERSERYGTPIFTHIEGDVLAEHYRQAIFKNLNDSLSLLDSVLYEVGEFDTVTGEISQVMKADYKLVARLGDFVKEAMSKLPKEGAQNA